MAKILLTIDCEEWNSPFLRGKKDPDHNTTFFSRLGNEKLLALFRKHNIKATFFITGVYAEREREDVQRIASEGHEIACHGYEHHYRGRVFDIAADVRQGKKVLEKITGQKVLGFRAPQAQYSEDLLRILDKAGFEYDSSLHPAFLPGYYNYSSMPLQVHSPISGLKIREVPVAVMPGIRLPIVWMFMRLLGARYTQLGVNGLVKKGINPILYFHSWEFTSMNSKLVPFYFTWRTGDQFVNMLEKFIVLNKKKGREFVTIKESFGRD